MILPSLSVHQAQLEASRAFHERIYTRFWPGKRWAYRYKKGRRPETC